jgi:hypothetical protein
MSMSTSLTAGYGLCESVRAHHSTVPAPEPLYCSTARPSGGQERRGHGTPGRRFTPSAAVGHCWDRTPGLLCLATTLRTSRTRDGKVPHFLAVIETVNRERREG